MEIVLKFFLCVAKKGEAESTVLKESDLRLDKKEQSNCFNIFFIYLF